MFHNTQMECWFWSPLCSVGGQTFIILYGFKERTISMYTEVDRHYSECAGSILCAIILRVIKLWVDLETEDKFWGRNTFYKREWGTNTQNAAENDWYIYIYLLHTS